MSDEAKTWIVPHLSLLTDKVHKHNEGREWNMLFLLVAEANG